MKRYNSVIFFLILTSFLSSTNTQAQDVYRIAGFSHYVPMGDLSDYYVGGIGFHYSYEGEVGNSIFLSGNSAFFYMLGKKFEDELGNEERFEGGLMVSMDLAAKYYFLQEDRDIFAAFKGGAIFNISVGDLEYYDEGQPIPQFNWANPFVAPEIGVVWEDVALAINYQFVFLPGTQDDNFKKTTNFLVIKLEIAI